MKNQKIKIEDETELVPVSGDYGPAGFEFKTKNQKIKIRKLKSNKSRGAVIKAVLTEAISQNKKFWDIKHPVKYLWAKIPITDKEGCYHSNLEAKSYPRDERIIYLNNRFKMKKT